MQVLYGPPGHKGVTQIMGLGATLPESGEQLVRATEPCKLVAGLSVLTYVVGAATGSTMAKNMGLGGLAALLLTRALKGGAEQSPTTPGSVQGWG